MQDSILHYKNKKKKKKKENSLTVCNYIINLMYTNLEVPAYKFPALLSTETYTLKEQLSSDLQR